MKQYNIHFEFVSTYIIGSGGDRTVGAPYCRGDPNVTYHYLSENLSENNPKKLASLNREELKLYNNFDNQIKTYSQFLQIEKMLKNVIEAQMFGKEKDKNLIDRLNKLKLNITNNIKISGQKIEFEKKFGILFYMANGGLRSGKLDFGAKKIK